MLLGHRIALLVVSVALAIAQLTVHTCRQPEALGGHTRWPDLIAVSVVVKKELRAATAGQLV